MIKGLHHASIGVEDLEQSLKFYTEILGLKIVRKIEIEGLKHPLIHLAIGESKIELRSVSNEKEAGLRHISIKVNDVNAAVEELKKKGIKFIREHPPFFKDPDGVLIEINK